VRQALGYCNWNDCISRFAILLKKAILINALRQIVTTKNGVVSIRIPKEYTQKRFELIVLPIDKPTDFEQIKAKMNAFLKTFAYR
jgi:hypothetical protein